MNCYYHPDHDAVAQCADCGKGLCRSCATRFTIPICPECNGVRRRSELRGCIVPLLLCGLLFAIGYNSEFMGPDRLFGAYMLMSVYGGWKFINRFCPFVFVWFSVEAIFWYFLIKVALSMLIDAGNAEHPEQPADSEAQTAAEPTAKVLNSDAEFE